MTSSARLSVLAALLAAFSTQFAQAEDIPFDADPMIEAGAASNNNANNITISNERTFVLSAGTQCDDEARTVILSEVDRTNITIGANGLVEINNTACTDGDPILTGIQINNNELTPEERSTGTVTINGELIMPDLDLANNAIVVGPDMGTTDITIGGSGVVEGNITLGQAGDHTIENRGEYKGQISVVSSSDGDPEVAPRSTITITNDGMMTADDDDFLIMVDDTVYTETETIVSDDPEVEDVEQLVREHQVVVVNNENMQGDIYFGPSGNHVFRNNGIDNDLDDTVLNGYNGTVFFAGNSDSAPPESLGGTYQNFGTHVAGDDEIAVFVSDAREGTLVLGGYDEELNRHTISGVNITNAFGGIIWGDIVVEGADSDGFTNQGTLAGRVMFDAVDVGENLVTLSGGTIFRRDGDDSDMALVSTGDGRDRVILSGTFLSPNEIVEPEEGEEPEDPETVDMTLIDLGDGDDFATLSNGGLIGATTALDGGDGNDHITITPSGTSVLAIEGEISGGDHNLAAEEGDPWGDTLEINGGTTGLVTEVTGEQKYTDFENFRVTSGEVHLNLTEEVEAVEAQEATEDMEAVEAVEGMDATLFDVGGGDLFIGEGAVLRLGTMGSLHVESGDFIRHFNAMTGTNDGTLVFDTMTEIHNNHLDASFTNAATGTLAFAITTETDEEGVTTLANQGMLYDSRTYAQFDKDNAQEIYDSGRIRLLLEADSGIGLTIDTATLSTDLDPTADLFDPVSFDIIKSPSIVVRTFDDDDPDMFEDVVVDSLGDLANIELVDENPFYSFEFSVDPTSDGTTTISVIATRAPAFAFALSQQGHDVGAGRLLDKIFDELARDKGCLGTPESEDVVCVMDREIRDLARLGFGAYNAGVRGFEPNRHSGLWEGMLNNHKMTLGVVSLRSATYRADAGGMSPAMTQYAALPSYSTSSDVLSVAGQQSGITGVNAGSIWETNRFWIQGFGGLSDRENSATDAGHQTANGGVVIGYDRRMGRTQMFGLFASYGIADINSSNIDQEEVKINSYSGGIYYTAFSRTASAEVSFSGGGSNIEGDRKPFLGGGTASYDTSGWHLALRAGADTNAKAGRFLFTPNAAFQYTFMRQGEYDETGTSPALLSVDGINMHSVETTLGVNVGLPIRMGRLAALPKFKLSWQHEFLDDTGDVDATLINIPSAGSFSAAAVEVPADRFTTGLGFDLASRGGTTFTMGYDFTLGDDFEAHGGAATFRFPF